MMNCMFCSQDSAGKHQPYCPNSNVGKNADFVRFLDELSSDSNIELRPFDSLIEKYMGLVSAFMMTTDLIDVAGDQFGVERLEAVAAYVLKKLDECIGAIAALQEKEDDDRDEE